MNFLLTLLTINFKFSTLFKKYIFKLQNKNGQNLNE